MVSRGMVGKWANLSWVGVLSLSMVSMVSKAGTQEIDGLMAQWLSLEKQKNAMQSQWHEQQPILKQRIHLLKGREAQLNQQIQRIQQMNMLAREEISERVSVLASFKRQEQAVNTWLFESESTLHNLMPQLPPVLQKTLHSFSQENGSGNKSLMLNGAEKILARVEAITQFNEKISIAQSVVQLDGLGAVLVKQLYFGLSFAWFSSADGAIKGFGRVDNQIWQWQQDDNIDATEILSAIEIAAQNKEVAGVTLPIQLSGAQVK